MAVPLQSSSAQMLKVAGSWGEFAGAGGPLVLYLQGVAKPSADGTPESELADLLVPVREVFDLERLSFDQILQRDLDDNRVASALVPYLLSSRDIPRFFPPVLAVLVPFTKNAVEPRYGERRETIEVIDGEWEKVTLAFGDVFRLTRYRERANGAWATSNAELHLNRHRARLMVVDGQHRAMAVLAIQRTLTNSWERTRGSAYKHFYGDLRELDQAQLSRIGLPVCICLFPDVTGEGRPSLEEVCRRIFLDVNREARRPSESRNILMDDYDLRAVFTRAVFTIAKDDDQSGAALRLRHVEYDNPTDRIQVRKGVALTNVRTVHAAIEWLFAREDAFHENLSKTPKQGRPRSPNNERVRRLLRVTDAISADELENWGLADYQDIQVERFPSAARGRLGELFAEEWGRLIVEFFATFAPYAVHIRAVDDVYARSATAEDDARLARQALFEGQGLYFTLEEHKDMMLKRRAEGTGPTSRTAAEGAWETTQRWLAEIQRIRAAHFASWRRDVTHKRVQELPDEELTRANRVYDLLRTQAFQIGALMAIAHLAAKLRDPPVVEAGRRWIDAASAAWDFEGVRERMFDRQFSGGLTALYPGQLAPADWPFFRYAFFEQVLFGGGTSLPSEELELLRVAVAEGRSQLVGRVESAILLQARKRGERLSAEDAAGRALKQVAEGLRKCLKVPARELEGLAKPTGVVVVEAEGPEGDSADSGDDPEAEGEPQES